MLPRVPLRRLFTSFVNSPCRTFSSATTNTTTPKILVTGSGGQIGIALVKNLRNLYGVENVLATDIIRPNAELKKNFAYLNVLDAKQVDRVVVENEITWIVHLSALLSAAGERNFDSAFNVNIIGAKNILETAKQYNCRVYSPSSIAAFGPTTPLDFVPDVTIQRPTTIYGISKVFLEHLGEYYNLKWGVDFRSLRYPGIISASPPGGGTTDYAVEIFFEGLKTGKYTCFLKEDTPLPMMYMPDCIKATVDFLTAPAESLQQRTYNIAAFTFSPKQLEEEIKRHIPHLQVNYKPDFRQGIADSWPKVLDDSRARADWGWKAAYNLTDMTSEMIKEIKKLI